MVVPELRVTLADLLRSPPSPLLPPPQAFAASQDLQSAGKYYKQLRRCGRVGLASVSATHRRMWELLIENYCRQHKVAAALQVFDDWKAASDEWLAAQQHHPPNLDGSSGGGGSSSSSSNGGVAVGTAAAAATAAAATSAAPASAASASVVAARLPKLSNVSLAFLEACCRSEPQYEWRVWDVCAVMRQQKEMRRQAGLARPQKLSHHFAPGAAAAAAVVEAEAEEREELRAGGGSSRSRGGSHIHPERFL